MATEYTITYTYTGQTNTSGTRSVQFSKFRVSGDTGRNIGQITSIQYIHYHTSTNPMTWNLRGRLVFGNGSFTITSDTVGNHISGDIIKYTNTFNTLPTAAQFAELTSVETLDTQGKTTAGGYSSRLYWRATSDHPMKIIVKFIEEPPVFYGPSVDTFNVQRVNAQSFPSEEGEYIATTLKVSMDNTDGYSKATCKIYYAADAQPQIGDSNQVIDLTSRISELRNGVALNTTILTGIWRLANTWNFVVVFSAGEEIADLEYSSVFRGSVSLHVAGEPGAGAAIGGFSTATTSNPKFESFVPAHFYGGVEGLSDYSTTEQKTIYKWIDDKPIYRRVFMFSGTIASGTSTTDLATISNFSEIDQIIDISGSIITGTQMMPLFRFYSTSVFNSVYINNGVIRLRRAGDSSISAYCIIVLYYTKK